MEILWKTKKKQGEFLFVKKDMQMQNAKKKDRIC